MKYKNIIDNDTELDLDDLSEVSGGFGAGPTNRVRYICDGCKHVVLPSQYKTGMSCPVCGGTSFTKKGSGPIVTGG